MPVNLSNNYCYIFGTFGVYKIKIYLSIYLSIYRDLIHPHSDIETLFLSPFSFSSFFNTILVSSHMYPANPEGTQVIVGSTNMGYIISDTARNLTHNLFRPRRELIPLGHSDGQSLHPDTLLFHQHYPFIHTQLPQ